MEPPLSSGVAEAGLETVVSPPTPAGPQRPLWHPLVRSALFLVGYLGIQITVAIAGGTVAFLLSDRWFQAGGFARSNEALLLAIAFFVPPTVGMTWLFVHFLDRRPLASFGARWPQGGRRTALRQLVTMPLGAVALLGSWLVLVLLLPASLAAVRQTGISRDFVHGPAWWPLSPSLLLVSLLALFLLQGGLEEWVVRGYIYHALKDRWRPWIAALASSLLFSLLHIANPAVSAVALLNIVLAGMVLAALVERSGSLWSATLAHGAWNFAVACLLSVPVSGVRLFHLLDVSVSGDARWTGGAFGPEGSLLLTFLGVPLAAALWWRIGRDRPRRENAPSAPEDSPRPALLGESMV